MSARDHSRIARATLSLRCWPVGTHGCHLARPVSRIQSVLRLTCETGGLHGNAIPRPALQPRRYTTTSP